MEITNDRAVRNPTPSSKDLHEVELHLRMFGEFLQPVGTRVEHVDPAGQGRENRHQRLGNMASSKNRDVPRLGRGDFLKQKRHLTAARHADVALKIPTRANTRVFAVQNRRRLFQGLRLHFSAAKISRHQSAARDDGLGAELSRHAAPHRRDGDHHGVHSLAAQCGDLFPSVHQLP